MEHHIRFEKKRISILCAEVEQKETKAVIDSKRGNKNNIDGRCLYRSWYVNR